MILSKPTTAAAFVQLISALDAEVKELNGIGSRVANEGNAKNAKRVMTLAGERARLRDHIDFLHHKWAQDEPDGIDQLPVQTPELPTAQRHKKSPSPKGNEKMALKSAAKKLGVSEAKMAIWLEAGTLKGYRGVSGRWKITKADLIHFFQLHHDLL